MHEADNQQRKRDIQAVAEVTALSILGKLLELPLGKNLNFQDGESRQQFANSSWLRDILQTVQSDKEKLTLVDTYVKNVFTDLPSAKLEELRKWFKSEVQEESKKLRLLRQAFYYRNRSVNAILAYVTLEANSELLKAKISEPKDAIAWFFKVKTMFRQHGKGEKFTRNSYLSEWEAFLNDVWPALPNYDDYDEEKSLNHKFKLAIQSKTDQVDVSFQSPRARRLLKKYANQKTFFEKDSLSAVKQLPSIEMKVHKGVGIFANLRFERVELDDLLNLSSKILLKSLSEDSLSGISTEIVKSKIPSLVVKCECEPNAQTLRDFEAFIAQFFQ